MTGFWTPLAASFANLWGLLANLLLDGLPARMRQRLLMVETPTVVTVASQAEVQDLMILGQRPVVDLVVSGQLVLAHRFFLPIAAKGDMKNAVKLEVERIMPLESRLFYIAQKLGERVGEDTIEVLVLIVRRQVAAKLLAAAEGSGAVVRRFALQAADDREAIDLPFTAVRMRNISRALIAMCLVASSLFALSFTPTIYQTRLEAAIAKTDEAIRASRQKTQKIAGLQRQVRAMQSLSDAVAEQRQMAQILDLMVQLTEASPDSVTIEEMRLDGNRLAIRGLAHAPEDWVVGLQEHKAFSDVTLLSVIGGRGSAGRRFEVRMDVLWPHERRKDEE